VSAPIFVNCIIQTTLCLADQIEAKRRKLDEENRALQEQRTEKWCFVENKVCIMCLMCKQSVSVPKDDILKVNIQISATNILRNLEIKKSNFRS